MLKRILKRLSGAKPALDVRSSWTTEPSKFKDVVEFLNWFDSTSSIEDTLTKAAGDWSERITNFDGFTDLNKTKSLEIGFGGGRLLTQSSRDFQTAAGVDIHSGFQQTSAFLENQDISNYKLFHRDQLDQMADSSVDFVYSFIVFQHFDSFKEVNYYLNHIKRLLQPEGYAHIFFGKQAADGITVTSAENFTKRDCSLFMEPQHFFEHLTNSGFIIRNQETRLPKHLNEPFGPGNESGQARILFQKK